MTLWLVSNLQNVRLQLLTRIEGIPDAAGLAAMSDADRNALGATLKDRGNKLYAKKDFKKAVECYTKAIEVSVKKDAVFYSNRAACEFSDELEEQFAA